MVDEQCSEQAEKRIDGKQKALLLTTTRRTTAFTNKFCILITMQSSSTEQNCDRKLGGPVAVAYLSRGSALQRTDNI